MKVFKVSHSHIKNLVYDALVVLIFEDLMNILTWKAAKLRA